MRDALFEFGVRLRGTKHTARIDDSEVLLKKRAAADDEGRDQKHACKDAEPTKSLFLAGRIIQSPKRKHVWESFPPQPGGLSGDGTS